MDEVKRHILEEAGLGEKIIQSIEERDAVFEKADITEEKIWEIQKGLGLSSNALHLRDRLSYDFVIFCHSDEPWKDRRKIKKTLKPVNKSDAARHIQTCTKCQELLPYLIHRLQDLLVQK